MALATVGRGQRWIEIKEEPHSAEFMIRQETWGTAAGSVALDPLVVARVVGHEGRLVLLNRHAEEERHVCLSHRYAWRNLDIRAPMGQKRGVDHLVVAQCEPNVGRGICAEDAVARTDLLG